MIGLVVSEQPMQVKQVVLNGVYDKYGRGEVSNIVQGILFADVSVQVGSGQHWWDESWQKQVSDWRQTLDMQRACLRTEFTLAGAVRVQHELYALRQLPHSALIKVRVEALQPSSVTVRNLMRIPAPLQPGRMSYKFQEETPDLPLLIASATTPTGKHRLTAANAYLFAGKMPVLTYETLGMDAQMVHFRQELAAGEALEFAIVGSICATEHFSDPENEAVRASIFAALEGVERLVARHAAAWSELWQGDIQIEGDLRAQQAVRFALFNLYSFARAGSGYSLSPMGLSSTGYNGHIFWDCELWMYPPLLVLQPEIAQTLLDYRLHRLPAARRKARSYGYRGAMFPWESDDTGEECTPTFAITGPFEHHITACIGIAFWNYYRVTGDKTWLAEKGYPLLREVAEFWLSRVERNAAGHYEIKKVVGADEYTGVVDNNAFTNGAATTVLRFASLAAQTLGLSPDPRWEEVAGQIVIRQFADGTTQEYDGYDGRLIKQADVNLLAYPLEIVQEESRIRQDLDYYVQRMDYHAPAMSHSVLATILARLGDRDRAAELFDRAYQPNQKPPFGVLTETPLSDNPYFATAAGGLLQAVLFGFAGLRLTDQGLVAGTPCLPSNWKSLTITGVGVERKTIHISNL